MHAYREIETSNHRQSRPAFLFVAVVVVTVLLVAGVSSSTGALRSFVAVRGSTAFTRPVMPVMQRSARVYGSNHVRRKTKTLEKVDMPSDITVLGPDPMGRKPYYPKLADTKASKETWFILDAEDQVLGRLATLAATLVMGKWHPLFTPSMNMGANVVIINADKIRVTGRKYTDKLYRRHTTGRPGKMKTETFRDLQERIPERIVETAIRGMLPKTRLGREQYKQLHIYAGDANPHEAQKPVDVTFKISSPVKKTFMQDRELSAA